MDQKKIKNLILIDGDGDSYKIKNKFQFQSFKETIQNQENTKIEGSFNYDRSIKVGSTQRGESSSVSRDEIQQVLETMLQPIKEEIKKLSHTVCEFNEMKGHLSEITSGKEDTQELRREPTIIQALQHDVHVDKIHTDWISFILELTDTRIATCSEDKSISIVSLDYQTKKWKQDIKQVNAHSNYVLCLCELSNNRLVSCSGDNTIKV